MKNQSKGVMYNKEQLKAIRSKVMILAHSLKREHNWNMSQSLSAAWKMVKQSFYTKAVVVKLANGSRHLKI